MAYFLNLLRLTNAQPRRLGGDMGGDGTTTASWGRPVIALVRSTPIPFQRLSLVFRHAQAIGILKSGCRSTPNRL
jgi:hypothetical protein